MNQGSPNHNWHLLGCNVTRKEVNKLKTEKHHRIITDSFNRVVCDKAGYEMELSVSEFLMGE